MTEQGHPEDLERIREDDLLLDSLGRGEPASTDDEVAALLAAWRADLAHELPAVRARRRLPRPRAIAVAAAVMLIAALGGVSLAALGATPGSPLWPISQILNPDRADVLAAQAAIGRVRTAIGQQRYDEAARLIDQAQVLVNKVHDGKRRQPLQAELDALRRELATRLSGSPAPPGAAASQAPSQAPGAGATRGGGAAPQPSPTGNGGGILPLPSPPGLPLPSLPGLPLPSLPIRIP
jgi:Anti-sigma-D factor RsdA to sigma factor binding region